MKRKATILNNVTDIGDCLWFERTISDLSARFINLETVNLDSEIEHALKVVLRFFQVDRCGLLHTLPGRDAWEITYVAYSEHGTPVPIAGASINSFIRTQGTGDIYWIYLSCQKDGLDFYLAYIPETFDMKPKEDFD